MYVKIRRHQHTRVHAHAGPRRHTRPLACRRHLIKTRRCRNVTEPGGVNPRPLGASSGDSTTHLNKRPAVISDTDIHCLIYRNNMRGARRVVRGLLLTTHLNQSIKGPHKVTHGPRRSHIASTTIGGANPASQSEAGLGGYERVATALICETRSFSTPFIFQWRAYNTSHAIGSRRRM